MTDEMTDEIIDESMTEKLRLKIKEKWPAIKVGIAFGLFIALIAWLFGLFIALVVVPISVLSLFLFAYFYLAKRDISFTFMEEPSAKAVVRGGQFHKLLIAWKGHTYEIYKTGPKEKEEENWEIVEGSGLYHLIGGFRFYGIWPIDKIHGYPFEWTHLHEGGEVKKHKKETIKSIPLSIDPYVIQCDIGGTDAIEDIDGIPMAIKLILPVRITNPYIAIFIVSRWWPLVGGIAKAVLKEFVGRFRYKEDLINMRAGEDIRVKQKDKGLSEKHMVDPGIDLTDVLWDDIKKMAKELGVTKTVGEGAEEEIRLYGVAIVRLGFRILSIDPHPDLRAATTQKYVAEKNAEVTVINAQAKAEAATSLADQQATQSMGLVIRMLSQATGRKFEEIQKKIRENESLQCEVFALIKKLADKQVPLNYDAFFQVEVTGTGGGSSASGDLLATLAVMNRMLEAQRGAGSGEKGSGEREKPKKETDQGGGRKKPEDMTKEERYAAAEEIIKKGFQ